MRISEIIAGLMSLRKDAESHIGLDDDFNDVFYHDIKVLDAVIAELRKKVACVSEVEILTVHGLGYKAVLK